MHLDKACTEFLSGYFSTHERSSKTLAAYRSDLSQFQKFAGDEKELAEIESTLIEEWAAQLKRDHYAPASIKRKIVLLKVFCSYWVRRGTLSQSPFWRIKLSLGRIEQLPRALSELEMKAFFTQIGREKLVDHQKPPHSEPAGGRPSNTDYRGLRNWALFDILFATGIRVGEASALDLADFLVHEATFKIRGKGGRDRIAFAADEASLRVQKSHLDMRRQIVTKSSALFVNSAGGRLSTQGITNVIAKMSREAGIERRVTPHMLRHTVATLLLRNGVNIRVVQEFLGHASIATTQRYTHISKEYLASVLRQSHPSINLRVQM